MMKNLQHFQNDCAFHPVRCFKCRKLVRRGDFVQHYIQVCRDSTRPSFPSDATRSDGGEPIQQESSNESLLTMLKNIEELVEKKLDTYVQKQDEKLATCVRGLEDKVDASLGASAEVQLQVEELRKEVSSVANDVKAVGKSHPDAGVTASNSSEVLGSLVCQLSDDVALLNKKQDGITCGVADVSKMASSALEKVGELAKEVSVIGKNVTSVMDGASPGIIGIKESVAAVPRIIGEQKWMRRVAGNQVHWLIKEVSKLLVSRDRRKSPEFAIGGYVGDMRCVLVMDDRGTRMLRVSFALLRPPRDTLLPWHPNASWSLSLIHPEDTSRNIETRSVKAPREREKYSRVHMEPWLTTRPGVCRSSAARKPNPVEPLLGLDAIVTLRLPVEKVRSEGSILGDGVLVSLTLDE